MQNSENDCIFCKIINGVIKSEKLYEDDEMIVIKDIQPKAKIHLLMIPKEHYKDILNLNDQRAKILSNCLLKLQKLSKTLGLDENFRVVINCGEKAGQSVFHLHVHLLAGF